MKCPMESDSIDQLIDIADDVIQYVYAKVGSENASDYLSIIGSKALDQIISLRRTKRFFDRHQEDRDSESNSDSVKAMTRLMRYLADEEVRRAQRKANPVIDIPSWFRGPGIYKCHYGNGGWKIPVYVSIIMTEEGNMCVAEVSEWAIYASNGVIDGFSDPEMVDLSRLKIHERKNNED